MRIGILTDIHEDVERLREALAALRERRAETIVMLGDVCFWGPQGARVAAACALLAEARAIGVWGNHDLGLCCKPDPHVLSCYDAATIAYMASLKPRLELAGCLFSHIEPWLDARDPDQLWHFEGVPKTPAKAARSFAAAPQRIIILGHFHEWFAVTPSETLEWFGIETLVLRPDQRYLIGVDAVCRGWCALLDTDAASIEPIALG